MARGRCRAPAVPVRPWASVCRRPAPGPRYRRGRRLGGGRSRVGHRELRRHGPVLGKERHDRDAGWILGDTHASRLDHRGEGRGRRRRRSGGDDRPGRRRRGGGALRAPRCARDRAGAGLPRPGDIPAAARRRAAGRGCACAEPGGCPGSSGARSRSGARPTGRPTGRSAGAGGSPCPCLGAGRCDDARAIAFDSRRCTAGRRGGCSERSVDGAGPCRPAHGRARRRACAPARCAARRDEHSAEAGAPCRARTASRERGSHPNRPHCDGEAAAAPGRAARPASGSVPAARDDCRALRRATQGGAAPAPARGSSHRRSRRVDAAVRTPVLPHEPGRLPPRAAARRRRAGPRGRPAKGRTYHCSRCAST